MKIQLHHYGWLMLILFPFNLFSQDTLDLIANPSFEAEPKKGSLYDLLHVTKPNFAETWFDCGKSKFPNESRPDIFPLASDFATKIGPSDGFSYLGLVVRDNGTWEHVSHVLSELLEIGKCYRFSIDLAKSSEYLSKSKLSGLTSSNNFNYNKSIVLKIWGGLDYCEELEILYESPPVDNEEWQSYEIYIEPKTEIKYITLQAYYIEDGEAYNGNVLVDNISPILKIDCKE